MKIFNAQQIKMIDRYTIEHTPIPSIDLMENAAQAFCQWFLRRFAPQASVYVFCGKGNNGGDGLAVARILLQAGYTVYPFVIEHAPEGTDDFYENYQRLKALTSVTPIQTAAEFPTILANAVIIDALFGAGLNRPLTGLAAQLITYLNEQLPIKIAIDIPSGLYVDQPNSPGDCIFQADHVVSFEFPKLAFVFPQNERFCREWHIVPIGLHPDVIAATTSPYTYLTEYEIEHIQSSKQVSRFSHKGTFGHALLVAGSKGKMGAALLSVGACLRSGAGLTTAYIPQCGYTTMQITRPEAMALLDPCEDEITTTPSLDPFTTIAVGPGIGTSERTYQALKQLLLAAQDKRLVVDADALNLIALHSELLQLVPSGSIFTPHPKELERLMGTSANEYERLYKAIDFAKQHDIVLIVKGAHTAIISANGEVYFNSTGNPGMATGGSGDVLTGIITGYLCQGYNSLQAAILGVYVHGKAGDQVAKKRSQASMIASDLIHALGLYEMS